MITIKRLGRADKFRVVRRHSNLFYNRTRLLLRRNLHGTTILPNGLNDLNRFLNVGFFRQFNLPKRVQEVKLVFPKHVLLPAKFQGVQRFMTRDYRLSALSRVPRRRLRPRMIRVLRSILSFIRRNIKSNRHLTRSMNRIPVLSNRRSKYAQQSMIILKYLLRRQRLFAGTTRQASGRLSKMYILSRRVARIINLTSTLRFFAMSYRAYKFEREVVRSRTPFG